MRQLMFVLLTISMGYSVSAQDYVIKNNGDTLKGLIKVKMFEYQRYSSIKMVLENGDKMIFQPTDISGYKQEGDIFESVNISKKGKYLQFLRLLVVGHCKLYDYKFTTMMSYGMQSSIQTSYYFKRNDEKIHEYSYVRLMKGIDTYFVDNGPLAFDIKMKKYKKGDVRSIVKRYNEEWVSSQ